MILKDEIFIPLCSAIFFASLLGLTLKAIKTALEAEEITLEQAQKLWRKYQLETKERLK